MRAASGTGPNDIAEQSQSPETFSIEPRVPYFEHLGIRLRWMRDGRAELEMPAREELSNSRGHVHGGSLASLLEAAMLLAVRSAVPPGACPVSITLNVTFMASGRGRMIAHATTVRVGGTMAMVEGRVEGEDGSLITTGSGVFRIFRPGDRKPASSPPGRLLPQPAMGRPVPVRQPIAASTSYPSGQSTQEADVRPGESRSASHTPPG